MAYAPFRVTEKQWTDMFKENEDRISHENLVRLLEALGNCDVVSEATVSNLSKSLHVLCGFGTSRDISNIIPFGSENTVNGLNEENGDGGNGNAPNISGQMMIEGAESGSGILVGSYHAESDTFTFNHDQVDREDNNDVMVCIPQKSDIEDRISLRADRLNLAEDLALDNSDSDEELWDDGSSEDDIDEGVSDKPSAYEILEIWKEMREEDSSLLHSKLGCG
ncbi:pentatricopeptide repeat-containing protein [Sesbania bispinosa]|nr:pentatricopeptide repeat-containing protein [Sesbania bispinosa]